MIEKHLTHPDSPIMVVVWEKSRPVALVSRKLPQCPKENQLIGPPQILIPRVPRLLLGWLLSVDLQGTAVLIVLKAWPLVPTPWRAVSSPLWSFADWIWSWGWLRCLRAMPLEMPLLSTVITSPSLFTWVPLGIFLRLFQSWFNSLCWGFSLLPGSSFCLIFLLIFSTIIYHLNHL